MIGSTLHVPVNAVPLESSVLAVRPRTISYNDRVVPLNGFIDNSPCQVDCEHDRVHLSAQRVEGRLEEHYQTESV